MNFCEIIKQKNLEFSNFNIFRTIQGKFMWKLIFFASWTPITIQPWFKIMIVQMTSSHCDCYFSVHIEDMFENLVGIARSYKNFIVIYNIKYGILRNRVSISGKNCHLMDCMDKIWYSELKKIFVMFEKLFILFKLYYKKYTLSSRVQLLLKTTFI